MDSVINPKYTEGPVNRPPGDLVKINKTIPVPLIVLYQVVFCRPLLRGVVKIFSKSIKVVNLILDTRLVSKKYTNISKKLIIITSGLKMTTTLKIYILSLMAQTT